MKSFFIILFCLSTSFSTFSQGRNPKDSEEGKVKLDELPAVVIKVAGKDFSVYLPDRGADLNVRKLEEKFIAYKIGKDYEGFENYLVVMESDKGSLSATYNQNGKLTGVVENYENIKLPVMVMYSIYKNYPGWNIVNEKYTYSQNNGDITAKEYNLKIKKDKETLKLLVKSDGTIVKKS